MKETEKNWIILDSRYFCWKRLSNLMYSIIKIAEKFKQGTYIVSKKIGEEFVEIDKVTFKWKRNDFKGNISIVSDILKYFLPDNPDEYDIAFISIDEWNKHFFFNVIKNDWTKEEYVAKLWK